MLIKSKFNSRCKVCKGEIVRGDMVEWLPSQGARHRHCVVDVNDASSEVKEKKYNIASIILKIVSIYMFTSPLFLGAVYFQKGWDNAVFYCFGIPMFIAMFTGMKKTNTRVRVKWGSRRASYADVYATIIMIECGIGFALIYAVRLIN